MGERNYYLKNQEIESLFPEIKKEIEDCIGGKCCEMVLLPDSEESKLLLSWSCSFTKDIVFPHYSLIERIDFGKRKVFYISDLMNFTCIRSRIIQNVCSEQ